MSSSKNIFRTTAPLGDFLERLKTSHEVQDELPANRYTKSEIERRYTEAFKTGQTAGYESGFELGKQEGHSAGLQQGQAEAAQAFEQAHQAALNAFVENLEQLRTDAEAEYAVWFQNAEQRLAVLAVEIAKRALGRELAADPESVVEIARQALTEATEGTEFRIRVNLADAPILDSRKQDLLQAVSHVRTIEVVSDPEIRTGCIVESNASTVDARLETYLTRLADTIRGEAA